MINVKDSPKSDEELCQQLENTLNDLTQQADLYCGQEGEFRMKVKKRPLTRSFASRIHDLSHKGRGIHTGSTPYYHMVNKSLIIGKDTSPLVGEVARRAGEGFLPRSGDVLTINPLAL